MPEYKDDFWEELERLEARRSDAQKTHDKALAALFASRDSNSIAAPGVFDEYSKESDNFSAIISEMQDFKTKYTPYQ